MNRILYCTLTGIKVNFDKRNKRFYKLTLCFKFKDKDNKTKALKRSIRIPSNDIINTLNSLSNSFKIKKKNYCDFNLKEDNINFYLLVDEKAEILAVSNINMPIENTCWKFVNT